MSPTTPRSSHITSVLGRHSFDPYFMSESPVDYRTHHHYNREDHSMERYSEPDDTRDREGEKAGVDDESEEDKEPTGHGKKRKVVSRNKASPVSARPLPRAPGAGVHRPLDADEYAHLDNGDDESGTVASSSSSRKPSVTSMQGEEKVAIKATKSSRKDTRHSSVPDIPER